LAQDVQFIVCVVAPPRRPCHVIGRCRCRVLAMGNICGKGNTEGRTAGTELDKNANKTSEGEKTPMQIRESKESAKTNKSEVPKDMTALDLQGTWDITVLDKEVWEGFILFDPEWEAFIQFSTGWSAKGFYYEAESFKIWGDIPEQGKLEVTLDGTTGKGWLGEFEFQMSRRSECRKDASEYAAGKWGIWSKTPDTESVQIAAVTIYDDGTAMYDALNGGASEFDYKVDGHSLASKGSLPGFGPFNMTFTPDGTVALADLNKQKFDAWRE